MSRLTTLGFWLVLTAGLVLGGMAGAVAQDKRVALIIGIDAYKNLTKLQNAANDARAMDARLKAMGWETTVRVNATKREINRAIADFSNKIGAGAAGLFYYAGHGIQSGDRNYLIPVDADIETDVDLRTEAFDVNEIMRLMEEARNRVNIVILDACRDNPLQRRGRSAERGLAVVSAPAGAFVAYAAGPGQKAQDGDPGGNGIFTGELVKAMAEPGLKIEDVFKRVAANVRDRTGGRQVPWVQASLQGDFYFGSPAAPVVAAAPVTPPPVAPGADREGIFWSSIQSSTNVADFEEYLRQFPNGTFAGLARNRISVLGGKGPAPAARQSGGDQVASLSVPILEAIDKEYVVAQSARVREAPNVTAKQVGQLREGTKVVVLGKVKGENWFLLEQNGKPFGYVATAALEDPAAFAERSRNKAEQDRKAAEERAQQVAALDAQRQAVEAERRKQEEAMRAIEEARRQAEERERSRQEEEQRAVAERQRKADEERRAKEEAEKRRTAMVIVKPAPGGSSVVPAVGDYTPPPRTVFRDCADGCPDMVSIRPGRYAMGASRDDREATSGEKPTQIVEMSNAFAIGATEVTRDQFAAFVRETGYRPTGCTTVSFNIVTGLNFGFDQARKWDNVGFDQTGRHPVVCVSFEDAKAYTRWLSAKTGRQYRLPSESEWEYVARAGSSTVRPWGENPNEACKFANVGDMTLNTNSTLSLWPVHSCRDDHAYTAPVATFPANAMGVFDMMGNVWEWTEDCWINSLAGHPQDASARTTGGDCAHRPVRGGAWFSTRSETFRTSFRAPEPIARRAPYIGFRVVRSFGS